MLLTGGNGQFATELYAAGTVTPGSGQYNMGEGSIELTAVGTGQVHEIDFTGLENLDDDVPLSDRLTVDATDADNMIALSVNAGVSTVAISDKVGTNVYAPIDYTNKPR